MGLGEWADKERERKRAYAAKKRAEDPERANAVMRLWRGRHIDKVRAKDREAKRRLTAAGLGPQPTDATRARNRAYIAWEKIHHPGRARARQQAWRARNADLVRARNREAKRVARAAGYRVNPATQAACSRRRRAREVGVAINDFTRGEWEILKDEFAGTCAYCGVLTARPHADHVIPLSKGGQHTYDNIVPACPPCNLTKGAALVEEFYRRTA